MPFHAVIKKAPVVKNTARMQITLQDIGSPGHMIQLVWYRMPYLKAQLVQGRHLIFYGHIKPKGGRYVMEQPVVYEVQKYEGYTRYTAACVFRDKRCDKQSDSEDDKGDSVTRYTVVRLSA